MRLALGAPPGTMTRFIVGRGMRYAVVGSGLGLVVTLVLVHRLDTLRFGVSPTDGLTIAAVATLRLAVALVACWLPGRRAARINPIEAIGSD